MIPEIKINDTCMMVEKVRLTATVMGVLDSCPRCLPCILKLSSRIGYIKSAELTGAAWQRMLHCSSLKRPYKELEGIDEPYGSGMQFIRAPFV